MGRSGQIAPILTHDHETPPEARRTVARRARKPARPRTKQVLFQSVTAMAPAGAVALSIAAGATYAGGALPLAVLLALGVSRRSVVIGGAHDWHRVGRRLHHRAPPRRMIRTCHTKS